MNESSLLEKKNKITEFTVELISDIKTEISLCSVCLQAWHEADNEKTSVPLDCISSINLYCIQSL